jgi:hypothetical protein
LELTALESTALELTVLESTALELTVLESTALELTAGRCGDIIRICADQAS